MPKSPPKRGGRPSLSGKGVAARIEIKLAPDVRDRVAALAGRQGVTISEFVREAIDLAIARGSTR